MDNIPRLERPAGSDDSLARRAAALSRHDLLALRQYRRSPCPVNRPIHAPTAQQRAVRRIDNSIRLLLGDITLNQTNLALHRISHHAQPSILSTLTRQRASSRQIPEILSRSIRPLYIRSVRIA